MYIIFIYDNVSEVFYGVLEQSLIEKTFDIEITDEMMDEIQNEIKESDIEDELSTGIIVDEIYNEENNPFAPMMESFRKFISTPMVIVGYVVVLLKVLKRKKQ